VTVQIHMLRLTQDSGQGDEVIAVQVPVVAIWIPSRLGAPWIVQDED
jgi:hypothetical protein